MKKLTVVLSVLALTACTRPEKAREVLESSGYTSVEITGYGWFSCSDDDMFKTAFRAKMNGRTVEGTVCSGILKGSTVRLD